MIVFICQRWEKNELCFNIATPLEIACGRVICTAPTWAGTSSLRVFTAKRCSDMNGRVRQRNYPGDLRPTKCICNIKDTSLDSQMEFDGGDRYYFLSNERFVFLSLCKPGKNTIIHLLFYIVITFLCTLCNMH